MNEMELLNEPVRFKMGNAELMLRKISSAKKRAIAQAYYIEQLTNEIKAKSKAFDDPADRKSYITEKIGELPSGQALIDLVEKMTIDTYLVCRYLAESCCEDITHLQAEELFENSEQEEAEAVLIYIHGASKKKSRSTKKSGGKSSATSRKKATRRKR